MSNRLKIQRTSRTLFYLYSALLLLLPLGVATYWLTLNTYGWGLPRVIAQLELPMVPPLSLTTLFLGFIISLLPAAVAMYGLTQLRKLFQLYSTGSVFTAANYICIRNLSLALLLWTPVRMVFDALLSVAFTAGNEPGERFIAVGVQEPELTAIFLGLSFLVISWVMSEACKLREDSEGIV